MSLEKINNIEEKISQFKNDFETWLSENLDIAKQLKKELLETAGVEEDELADSEMALVKVPVGELSIFGTMCGTKGNKALSGFAIDFLRSKGVEFIIGLGEDKEPLISSAAINISGEDAEKFSETVNSGKGSLRPENSKVSGWSVFESE